MRWIEYPTRRDYREDSAGQQLEGQYVSAAPGGGQWALTPDKRFHQVRTRNGKRWCIAEECPTPKNSGATENGVSGPREHTPTPE